MFSAYRNALWEMFFVIKYTKKIWTENEGNAVLRLMSFGSRSMRYCPCPSKVELTELGYIKCKYLIYTVVSFASPERWKAIQFLVAPDEANEAFFALVSSTLERTDLLCNDATKF